MRKTVAKLLIMAVMGMAVALGCYAEGWVEGRSPHKPYEGVPEAQFSENIGYMMMYPVPGETVDASVMTLYVYMPREDVQKGEGVLYLCSQEDGKELEISFADAQRVQMREMTRDELAGLLWGSGTCFEIRLPRSLTINKHYFINMTENCVVAPAYGNGNLEIGGTEAWRFDTAVEYGISSIEFIGGTEALQAQTEDRAPETIAPEMARKGDVLRFELELGENAAAAIYCPDDALVFQESYFEQTSTVSATIARAGEIRWAVLFLDDDGAIRDHIWIDIELPDA